MPPFSMNWRALFYEMDRPFLPFFWKKSFCEKIPKKYTKNKNTEKIRRSFFILFYLIF